ncbi:hypothetical protein COCNU_13G008260 [Cocos nucifera]|uniref:Uncharacterized protein n=1 Tax=Cocos nucifera TaxID=13894 RepID=A0A8K0NB69_COCNU|nr:hypothetical protein COCNU_13G008260 [Cocos nucifera]
MEDSLLPTKIDKVHNLSFQEQKKGAISTFHEANIFMTKKDAEATQAEASNYKAEAKHLKEVLKESERILEETKRESAKIKGALKETKSALEKAKFDLALEQKKRKATKSEATEVKEEEKKVAKAKHQAIEEFKPSKEFTMIKVQFAGEAFDANVKSHQKKVMSYHPKLNLDFLENEPDDLPTGPNLATTKPSAKAGELVEVPPTSGAEIGQPIKTEPSSSVVPEFKVGDNP